MKRISSNYGILVVLLFAVVCVLVDYIVISRKLNKCVCTECDCAKCEITGNVTKKVYSYDDISGYYEENITYSSEETDLNGASFMLHLYSDGTYSYRYSYHAPFGTVGNYIIKDNAIVLNALAETGSGAGINEKLFNVKRTIIINDDGSLTDSDAPMFDITGVKIVTLHKEVNDPIKVENEFINFFNYSENGE